MGSIDDSGQIVGFDIDVAQEVCNRLGVTLVKKPIDWDKNEEELNSGRIDCIWNGMSVTPERIESMCLSDPYMKNEFIFLLLGDSTVSELKELKGKLVGVQSGSTAEEPLTEDIVKELHRILKQITKDSTLSWFAVGDYKKRANVVGGRETAKPKDVPAQMAALLSEYESSTP